LKNFLRKRVARREFLAKKKSARLIQRLFRNVKKSEFARLNDQLVEKIMGLNADVQRVNKLLEVNGALEGDAWTFAHEYDYKQLLKQHESLQERTAVGINLSFIKKIARAESREYNALGVQKDSSPVDLKGAEVKDPRTNMQVCKAYLEEVEDVANRVSIFEKILVRENTMLTEINTTDKLHRERRSPTRRRLSSVKASFEPDLLRA